MACPDYNQLVAYHDGQLIGAAADGMASHLADCSACHAALGAFARADAALTRSADRSAASLNVVALTQRIIARTAPRRRVFLTWRAAALAASIALVAALGTWRFVGRAVQQPTASRLLPADTFAAASPRDELALSQAIVSPAQPAGTPRPDICEPGRAFAPMPPPAVAPTPTIAATPAPVAFVPNLSAVTLTISPDPYGELVRQVEVAMTQAALCSTDRASWRALADAIERDGLAGRVRKARLSLPAGNELAKLLASAEVMLTRIDLAGDEPAMAARLQQDILASDLLARCRQSRA